MPATINVPPNKHQIDMRLIGFVGLCWVFVFKAHDNRLQGLCFWNYYKAMFKKGKENCHISTEMVDFFNRQLSMLKEIANKMHQIDIKMATEQIADCVALI